MNDAPALLRHLLLWGVPFAIVVAALGYETDWGRGVTHDAAAPAALAPPAVAVALLPEYRIDGGIDARKETVERVLFNPTRRPAPPAAQAAGSGSVQHGLYALTGTTVVGSVATALLREVNGGKSRSVRQGDTLNGVLVAEVRPDRVRLKQGDDVEELALKLAAGPKSTVQVAPPPAPGQPAGQPARPVAPPAGGTGAVPAAPPVPPAAPAAPATPSAGATPGVVSVGELLAERRRAARAAAEAASQSGQRVAPAAQPR